jgi:hypothetical protein
MPHRPTSGNGPARRGPGERGPLLCGAGLDEILERLLEIQARTGRGRPQPGDHLATVGDDHEIARSDLARVLAQPVLQFFDGGPPSWGERSPV